MHAISLEIEAQTIAIHKTPPPRRPFSNSHPNPLNSSSFRILFFNVLIE